MTDTSRRGRPRTGSVAQHFTLPPDLSAALDAYAGATAAPLTRPEAIRGILADWLAGHGFLKRGGHAPVAGPATDVIGEMEAAIAKDRSKPGRRAR